MTPTLHRLACWGGFFLIVGTDALIGSPISLGLLYFVPLAAAAFWVRGLEAGAMAVLAGLGRFLFGPVGDPLGIQSVTLQLPSTAQTVTNTLVSMLAYATVATVIIRLRRQQQEIERLGAEVTRDPLTGLANRRELSALMTSQRGRLVSLIAVDLDHFKRVNDSYGHAAGDDVLRELAVRLRKSVRDGDVVVRTGGEEFVIVLPASSTEAATRVVERVLENVREAPFRAAGKDLALTTSAGLASGPASEALLEQADEALYAAKTRGRNRYVLAPVVSG